MSILLGLCLLLVMLSLIMALNAFTRLDKLRDQNLLMQKELGLLRQEYQQLQERFLGIPAGSGAPAATTAAGAPASAATEQQPEAAAQNPEQQLQEQLTQFQTIIEAYRHQNGGSFPASLDNLATYANRNGLQKIVENPFTHTRNPLISEDVCLDITHDLIDEGLPEYAGRLLFQAHLDARGQVTGYFLTGLDSRGMLLKRPDGEALTISHQG